MTNEIRKKAILFVGIFIGFIIIVSIVYIVITIPKSKNNTKDPTTTETYFDSASGKTVIITPNKTPESANGKDLLMLGFTDLINIGVSYDQVDIIKTDLSNYLTSKQETTQISVVVKSIIQTINKNTGEIKVNFPIIVNRELNFNIEITYIGINTPVVKILNPVDNSILYSSNA